MTCNERGGGGGGNMSEVWPGFEANVAGRHFLYRFEFRALTTVNFVLCLRAAVLHTLVCLRSVGASTLRFQDSVMLSWKRNFSVYPKSPG